MMGAPIVTIFQGSGRPMASGALVEAADGPAGLFSPWPESALADRKFSVYVHGRGNDAGEWLAPEGVAVMSVPGQNGPASLGVVTFKTPPTSRGFPLSLGENEFYALLEEAITARVPWLDALAAVDPGFEPLRILAYVNDDQVDAPPPADKTATVRREIDVTPASARGSFFCRYVIRND
jgi:hypothetical protein